MMRNYDFHELLSFDEFQRFSTELVSIREDRELRCNPLGPDGGVDFYDLDKKIIGQVKNYSNRFSSLKSSLKKEVDRVKRIKPNRYILVTSTSCNRANKEELISMFEGYLKYEDILDKNELNVLLEDSKYHHLEIEYLKLLVPNSFVLSHFLDKIQYKKIYTKTDIELNKIKMEKPIFSATESFDQAIFQLLEKRTIIISGEPGVGKSILGRMLSAYLISEDSKRQFISVNSIDQLYEMYNSSVSQIYFFDDFFGDIQYNFQMNSIEQNKLLDFINFIHKDKNKYLILTTREYILQEGIKVGSHSSNKLLSYKFSLDIHSISMLSKFNILFNHLKRSILSYEHIHSILKYWDTIISNPNYNPRLIETFLDNYSIYRDLGSFDFFKAFDRYLSSPYEYWESILTKQSFMEIIILIIISINNTSLDIRKLNEKYNSVISLHHLERDVLINFQESIKKMEDTFIITKLYDHLCVELKNPSYKDFILDYFSKNVTTYIPYIYNHNLTLEEAIHLWKAVNKNIDLYKNVHEVSLLQKLILSKISRKNGNDYFLCLVDLAQVTDFSYDSDIKHIIYNGVLGLIRDLDDYIYVDIDLYDRCFDLIDLLKESFDFTDYIGSILDVVAFSSGSFYEIEKLCIIKKLYPDIYKEYFNAFKVGIKGALYECALYDAYYYGDKNDIMGLEYLQFEYIPEVYSNLNIKVPKKLSEKLSSLLEKAYSSMDSKQNKETYEPLDFKNTTPKESQEKQELETIHKRISEVVVSDTYVQNPDQLLKKWKVRKKVRDIIYRIDSEDIRVFENMVHYEDTLRLMCNCIDQYGFSYNIVDFLDIFCDYLSLDWSDIEFMGLATLALLILRDNKVIFTRDEFYSYSLEYDIDRDKLLNSSFFLKNDKWYYFVHPIIHIYLSFAILNLSHLNMNAGIILQLTENVSDHYSRINFNYFNDIVTYHLISKMYPKLWHEEIEMYWFKKMINKVNTKNRVEIAKSIIKQFQFHFFYDKYGYHSYIYKDPLLMDLIRMKFDVDILELFNFVDNDDVVETLSQYSERHKGFEVNKYLNRKFFIQILEDYSIIDQLNAIYNQVSSYIEKDTLCGK